MSLQSDTPTHYGEQYQARLEAEYQAHIQAERDAWQEVSDAAQVFAESVDPMVWHWGDGYGGAVLNEVREALLAAGLNSWPEKTPDRRPKRRPLSKTAQRAVMERDFYRCVTCQTHLNLTVDHIIPVVKGGSNDLDNLQVLCGSCNSRKGDR